MIKVFPISAASQKSKVVLVVDDEPMMLLAACDVVEEMGFEALIAVDGEAAVKILESRSDISIVFTDIDMPGRLDGLKLAACIHDRWPPIHILITSGQVTPTAANLPAQAVFMAKPYRTADVQNQLRAMAA